MSDPSQAGQASVHLDVRIVIQAYCHGTTLLLQKPSDGLMLVRCFWYVQRDKKLVRFYYLTLRDSALIAQPSAEHKAGRQSMRTIAAPRNY